SVKVVPVGVSKGLKKLLQEKFPNMSRLEDISELLVKDINLSESEAEQDGPHNVTELPQAYAGRGNAKAQQSAVRLTEIGPRMTLRLIKVEEGLAQGNVLYHGLIHKTEAEVQELLARKEAKLRLKAERRQQQEAAVERKRRQREAQREKSLEGMRRKQQREDGDSDAEDPGAPEQDAAQEEEGGGERWLSTTGGRWARSRTRICSLSAVRGSASPRALPGSGSAGAASHRSIPPLPTLSPQPRGPRAGPAAPGTKRSEEPGLPPGPGATGSCCQRGKPYSRGWDVPGRGSAEGPGSGPPTAIAVQYMAWNDRLWLCLRGGMGVPWAFPWASHFSMLPQWEQEGDGSSSVPPPIPCPQREAGWDPGVAP
ncbi:LOW QUALITY PROTEIN: uncharacterized protein AAGF69_017489, partial [Amazona ochrocephala]